MRSWRLSCACLLGAACVAAAMAGARAANGTTSETQLPGRCAQFTKLEAESAIIFFVVAVFGGLICYHPLRWIPVPYTSLLLVRFLARVNLCLCAASLAHTGHSAVCRNGTLLRQAFGAVLGVANEAGANWNHPGRRHMPVGGALVQTEGEICCLTCCITAIRR